MWSVSCVMREGVDCEWCGDGDVSSPPPLHQVSVISLQGVHALMV